MSAKLLLLAVLCVSGARAADDENVVTLTNDNFESEVYGSKDVWSDAPSPRIATHREALGSQSAVRVCYGPGERNTASKLGGRSCRHVSIEVTWRGCCHSRLHDGPSVAYALSEPAVE